MTTFHPIFLDLEGRHCVIVGGGAVARPKLEGLLAAGADVTVIAPLAAESFKELAAEHRIELKERPYSQGDLDGAFLVIAATDDVAVNRAVHAEAQTRGCLVSVVDTLPLCNFITPSLIRRGDLSIAISTAGRAPAVAATLRRKLEDELEEGTSTILARARFWRRCIVRSAASPKERKTAWYELAREGRWKDAPESVMGLALPDSLELPVLPPSRNPVSWQGIAVLGTDLLHGSVEQLSHMTAVLEHPELQERLLALHDALGQPLLRSLTVLRSRQRAELVFESATPDSALEKVAMSLAELDRAHPRDSAPVGLALTGRTAVTHLACLASGLRSIVAFDADDAASLRLPETQDDQELLPSLLEACWKLGQTVLDATGLRGRHDAIQQHGLRFLRDRLPDFEACELSRGGQALDPLSPGPTLLVLLEQGSPRFTRERALELLKAGRPALRILDLAVPPATNADLATLNRVCRWDLDTLAELTPLPELSADVEEGARALLCKGLASLAEDADERAAQ